MLNFSNYIYGIQLAESRPIKRAAQITAYFIVRFSDSSKNKHHAFYDTIHIFDLNIYLFLVKKWLLEYQAKEGLGKGSPFQKKIKEGFGKGNSFDGNPFQKHTKDENAKRKF